MILKEFTSLLKNANKKGILFLRPRLVRLPFMVYKNK